MTTAAQQNDLESLSDEFDQAESMENWTSFHESEGWPNHALKANIDTDSEGNFHLEPNTGFWYGEVHCGPYYFKQVEGDFTVTTRVKASGKNTEVPQKLFSLAGLMIRSPRQEGVAKTDKGHENWLFLSTGYAKGKNQAQFETKLTIKGKSKLKILPAPEGWVEIAIRREGDQFTMYVNKEGKWEVLRTLTHPNMSERLQVGMIAYTDFNAKMKRRYIFSRSSLNTTVFTDGEPDLIARFEYIRFFRSEAKVLVSREAHLE
ncbi:MAG: DUF1349 domain-containing protein [Bacteroidota bacterium]